MKLQLRYFIADFCIQLLYFWKEYDYCVIQYLCAGLTGTTESVVKSLWLHTSPEALKAPFSSHLSSLGLKP